MTTIRGDRGGTTGRLRIESRVKGPRDRPDQEVGHPEGVHGDPEAHAVYGAGVPSGWMSRPRYVLHVGHAWCARVGAPQFGHTLTLGTAMPCWARRLSRRAFEVFRLGTAMGGRRVYRKTLCGPHITRAQAPA
jgi:hypothetical protein